MNEKKLQQKKYVAPKIEAILIEMESCFGFYPAKPSSDDKLEINDFLLNNNPENREKNEMISS